MMLIMPLNSHGLIPGGMMDVDYVVMACLREYW